MGLIKEFAYVFFEVRAGVYFRLIEKRRGTGQLNLLSDLFGDPSVLPPMAEKYNVGTLASSLFSH